MLTAKETNWVKISSKRSYTSKIQFILLLSSQSSQASLLKRLFLFNLRINGYVRLNETQGQTDGSIIIAIG
jgi:hypothetical protein